MATVCVTGASGFIAAHIVREMLEADYQVHGTLRGAANDEKYSFLKDIPGAKERLKLFEADLVKESSFDRALTGADYLIHVASPFFLNTGDPQNDLVTPAVSGVLNVLRSAQKAGSVKRVVLTSSAAAITDTGADGKLFTEDDWNEKSELFRDPYPLSKTEAEKAAWEFIESEKTPFDMVSINPSVVMGPSLGPSVSTSTAVIRDLLLGDYPIIMDITGGYVDVRDVARAHRLAMETAQASGRYICDKESWSNNDLVDFLKTQGYAGYKLPSRSMTSQLGSLFVKLISYTQPRWLGNYLRLNIGRPSHFDHSKIVNDLGIEFRPMEQSFHDTVSSLIEWGHLEKIPAQ